MRVLEAANLALRFVLELTALGVLAYWGWKTGDGLWRWALAVGAPLVAAVLWGAFVAPNARVDVPRSAQFVIELLVWTAAAAALYSSGHGRAALAFLAVAVVSGTLNWVWD